MEADASFLEQVCSIAVMALLLVGVLWLLVIIASSFALYIPGDGDDDFGPKED